MINSKFETIKVDKNYDDPIFQKHIGPILDYIEDYDDEQVVYTQYVISNILPYYQKVTPLMQKVVMKSLDNSQNRFFSSDRN